MFVVGDDLAVEFVEFEVGVVDHSDDEFLVFGVIWRVVFIVLDICFEVGLFVVVSELIFDGRIEEQQ